MSTDGDRPTPVMPENQSDEELAKRRIYERQEGESEEEWAAFKAYRDMEPPRLLHRAGHLSNVKVATAKLSSWYRKWKWAERVEAYDVLLDRVVQDHRKAILEQESKDITAEHMAMLHDLRNLISIEVRKYLDVAKETERAGLIKITDLKGLMEMNIKMDRLVRDQTTDKTEAEVDLSGFSVEELVAWNERLAKK